MAWFNNFTRRWASNGVLVPPTDVQADTGFGYLGVNPPTVEMFNSLFRDLDEKDGWLYAAIVSVLAAASMAPTQAAPQQLLAAIQALITAYVTPLSNADASLLAQINALLAQLNAVGGRVGTLEGKTGGRLIKYSFYGSPGTYNHVFDPACNLVIFDICGAGGGGGGAIATGAGVASVGSGGGSGAYTRAYYYNRLAVIGASRQIIVGAPGLGGVGTAGGTGAGGNPSSVTDIAFAPGGGGGGPISNNVIGSGLNANAGVVGNAAQISGSGGSVILGGGNPGATGLILNSQTALGGAGAPGPFGGGGNPVGTGGPGSNGQSATNLGAGGGGACILANTSARTGGAGAPGFVLVQEFSA